MRALNENQRIQELKRTHFSLDISLFAIILYRAAAIQFVARERIIAMTHPPRFLQTILDRPDDDSPRLRYATWLDGCGNPLGEFIRLQCVLAQNPISEPHIYYERREQALLA